MLEPDDGRQTQHFRAQHEHAEHGHQRKHAHDLAVGLQTCERVTYRLKKKYKKTSFRNDFCTLKNVTYPRIK